jgi:hypothetical protein
MIYPVIEPAGVRSGLLMVGSCVSRLPLPNLFDCWKFNPAAEATVIWLTDLMLASTQ